MVYLSLAMRYLVFKERSRVWLKEIMTAERRLEDPRRNNPSIDSPIGGQSMREKSKYRVGASTPSGFPTVNPPSPLSLQRDLLNLDAWLSRDLGFCQLIRATIVL